jgi:hypothetical protein
MKYVAASLSAAVTFSVAFGLLAICQAVAPDLLHWADLDLSNRTTQIGGVTLIAAAVFWGMVRWYKAAAAQSRANLAARART